MCLGANVPLCGTVVAQSNNRRQVGVWKAYGKKEGEMDGRATKQANIEKPIEKPSYPLPAVFFPGRRSEMPTRRQRPVKERAHFYRKQTTKSGDPVYGFYITTETGERENPGSRF